jgi:hypothetical protein
LKKILRVIPEKQTILVTGKSWDCPEPVFLGEKFDAWYDKKKHEIISRQNPEDRIEFFECRNENGVYDFEIEQRLLKARA